MSLIVNQKIIEDAGKLKSLISWVWLVRRAVDADLVRISGLEWQTLVSLYWYLLNVPSPNIFIQILFPSRPPNNCNLLSPISPLSEEALAANSGTYFPNQRINYYLLWWSWRWGCRKENETERTWKKKKLILMKMV